MAKKKKETGPGVFLILTLVFFVLASVVLGVTTYLGFEDAAQQAGVATTAQKDKDVAVKNAAEQTIRRNMNRIAMGTQDPEDQTDISGAAKEHSVAILEEYDRITKKLGANAFPTKDAFTWPLVAELAKGGNVDGDSKPSPSPNRTIPGITKEWAKRAVTAEAEVRTQKDARDKAQADAKAAQEATEQAKATFDKQVAALTEQVTSKINEMKASFDKLKADADVAGIDFKKISVTWAEEKQKLEDSLTLMKNDLLTREKKIRNLENPDASDILHKFRHWDIATISERMGEISDKSGTFVNLTFKKPLNLVSGQTFVVIPPTGSLVEVLEREKALEKRHHEVVSLGPRDPFADNEMIKGTVEITEVTSKYSARARITNEPRALRDPIGKKDQLFNVSMSAGGKEHVAFAGIIDLDGDGRENNGEFIRILENNNMIIDAYLDLKTGQIVKRGSSGMDFRTKFLVIGSDAPMRGNIVEMLKDAKEKGVQVIDARKFLSLIGVKPPQGAAPPAYTEVNVGGGVDLKNPKDPDAVPMPPAVDPKKQ